MTKLFRNSTIKAFTILNIISHVLITTFTLVYYHFFNADIIHLINFIPLLILPLILLLLLECGFFGFLLAQKLHITRSR